MRTVVVVALVAFALALVTTPVAMAVARRTGIVDRPGPLKRHGAPVPYLGGVAVFVAAAYGVLVGQPLVLAPLTMALALGVADDVGDLPPWFRLAGAVVIGVVVALVVPTHLPRALGPLLVVAVTVLLINGVNLLDGLDGLAGGVTAAACGAFALLLHGAARDLAVGFTFALVGFLAYNRPPARVYLGDGGAYLLGTALAVMVARAWGSGVRPSIGVAGLLLVAIPSAEVAFTVVRRLRGGRALAAGDRGHSYDRLAARGVPVGVVALGFIAAQVVLGGLALAVSRPKSIVPGVMAVVGVAVVLVAAGAGAGVLTPEGEAGP
jgi:UDP-GlcNAc:undecaprenyl-phosphate GlcNAc-1-phosphate transferase